MAFSPGLACAGLHLIGTRSDYEVLCVRVCRTVCPVSPDIAEFLSWQDVCALRALLAADPGDRYLRCEVWIIPPDGPVRCFEVTKKGVCEVAAYAG